MTKSLILEKYGKSIPVTLQVRSYLNGNLAIQMITCEDGEPWNTLTVNLGGTCKKDCAFIDTNDNGDSILPWLVRNGLAVPTGVLCRSGCCVYPEVRFRDSALKEADPDGYENYLEILQATGTRK